MRRCSMAYQERNPDPAKERQIPGEGEDFLNPKKWMNKKTETNHQIKNQRDILA